MFERETLEIVQEFKFLWIIIKASGIFNKGISELSNQALKVIFIIRKTFQLLFVFPTLQCRLLILIHVSNQYYYTVQRFEAHTV